MCVLYAGNHRPGETALRHVVTASFWIHDERNTADFHKCLSDELTRPTQLTIEVLPSVEKKKILVSLKTYLPRSTQRHTVAPTASVTSERIRAVRCEVRFWHSRWFIHWSLKPLIPSWISFKLSWFRTVHLVTARDLDVTFTTVARLMSEVACYVLLRTTSISRANALI